jgi:hypothetical protein
MVGLDAVIEIAGPLPTEWVAGIALAFPALCRFLNLKKGEQGIVFFFPQTISILKDN